MTGEAISGPKKGARLEMLPLTQMTWAEWRKLHPDTLVLSDDTPFRSIYRTVAKGGAMLGPAVEEHTLYGDTRLVANALVLGVEAGAGFRAYPLVALAATSTPVQEEVDGLPLVIFYDPVGSAALAFARLLASPSAAPAPPGPLSFAFAPGAAGDPVRFWDEQTHSTWTVEGAAIDGPLAGARLRYVPSFTGQWYGWSAYHPETSIWGSAEALALVQPAGGERTRPAAPARTAPVPSGPANDLNPPPGSPRACLQQAIGAAAYAEIANGARPPTPAERQIGERCQQPAAGR